MTTMRNSTAMPLPSGTATRLRWPVAVLSGAVLVALAGQVAVPVPFSPVPMTLQGPAVILVGGLFGGTAALGSILLYLAAGAFGAPVFANGGTGLARLFGPTGGYLLAFLPAVLVVARIAERGRFLRCLLAALAGMAVIHLGGWAQLALLTGSTQAAFASGVVPFLVLDPIKAVLAATVLWRGHHALRPFA